MKNLSLSSPCLRPRAGDTTWPKQLGRAGALLALSLLFSYSAGAQPGSGGPAPGGSPTQVPIDGGASLLLAGGVGYALRRLRRASKP